MSAQQAQSHLGRHDAQGKLMQTSIKMLHDAPVRGSEAEARRRMTVQVHGRPQPSKKPPKGAGPGGLRGTDLSAGGGRLALPNDNLLRKFK